MKVEPQPQRPTDERRVASAVRQLITAGCLGTLALSCSSTSDNGPASGGALNGGATSASAGANSGGGPSGGSVGTGGTSAQTVDCAGVCGHVKTLCSENNTISDVWVDACKSACDARVQLTPDVAELEQACVMAAADCSAAINCVTAPH